MNLLTIIASIDWPFSIDGDLTARPVGSAWDIGAHEETTPDFGFIPWITG